jgi:Flp pilus assembly protein TadD
MKPVREPSGVVSADVLRHPIKEKARRMLQKALEAAKSGEHNSAIIQLVAVLAKFPESAPYVHSILGVEYVKTNRFAEAVNSLEQAVALLPHDAVNRYNLAVSLLCDREVEQGEHEARRAVELDPDNPTMRALVEPAR